MLHFHQTMLDLCLFDFIIDMQFVSILRLVKLKVSVYDNVKE